MSERIEPRVLKGFRDFLPSEELARREIEKVLESVFRSYGYKPIDTPVLEYAEILLGKGGGETDKQVYRFTDHGDRDVAMRFDLTVPFARYMARYGKSMPLPFKRYHIAKVWRGENTQRGRYREFMQCDFDTVGTEHPDSDFETLMLIHDCFEALGIENVTIRLSHRGIFNNFLATLGISGHSVEIMRTVDKLAKIGEEEVHSLLGELVGEDAAERILEYIRVEDDFETTLEKLARLSTGETAHAESNSGRTGSDESNVGSNPVARLERIKKLLDQTGIGYCFVLDPSITRGLDYYTGIVYETFLTDLPEYGSVCSGGRYDDLASLYTKQHLPGVGASIGLDRLIAALEELGNEQRFGSVPEVAIINLDEALSGHYHSLARTLRKAGLSCDVFFEKRKIPAQFSHAEKLGSRVAVICGESEKSNNTVNIRDLEKRESYDNLDLSAAIERIRRILNGST